MLDLTDHNAPGVSVGSLEGAGTVLLTKRDSAANKLTVGSNNLNTNFSGIISVGEGHARPGSVRKIGSGSLSLFGANTYTGGTVVNGGQLLVNNKTGSGTGTGPVTVRSGLLGGDGTIAGQVSVQGTNNNAILSPAATGIGLLTIKSSLALLAKSTYAWEFEANTLQADQVAAQEITIAAEATFTAVNHDGGVPPVGAVLTAIQNTGASPISGTFSDLPDGGTIIIGSNAFQANYEGGDGNDLTLTVVP